MYELLHGITPFYAESVEEVFSNICKGEIEFLEADEVEDEDELLPEEARNFIQQFLNVGVFLYLFFYNIFYLQELEKTFLAGTSFPALTS